MQWRTLFILVFFLNITDGFLSHFLYPAKYPLLLKDFLIIMAFLFFAMKERIPDHISGLQQQLGSTVWLLAFALLATGFFQIFNPLSPGLVRGILGFKIMFFYWILAIMGFAYVRDDYDYQKFLKTIMYFSIPVNIFGIYQYIKGPASIMALGPGFYRAIALAGGEGGPQSEGFLRILGTFASSGQYMTFLVMSTMVAFALLHVSRSNNERLLVGAAQVLNFFALISTGSRSGLVSLILNVIVFGFFSRRTRSVLATAGIAAVGIYMVFNLLGSRVIGRYESLLEVKMVKDRTIGATSGMFPKLLEKYPMGKGLGAASTATRHLGGLESKYEFVENYPSKLQLELGIPGVLLFFLFVFSLGMHWIQHWFRSFDEETFELIVPVSVYVLTYFVIGGIFGIMDNPPIVLFVWTFVGMTAKMVQLSEEKYRGEVSQ